MGVTGVGPWMTGVTDVRSVWPRMTGATGVTGALGMVACGESLGGWTWALQRDALGRQSGMPFSLRAWRAWWRVVRRPSVCGHDRTWTLRRDALGGQSGMPLEGGAGMVAWGEARRRRTWWLRRDALEGRCGHGGVWRGDTAMSDLGAAARCPWTSIKSIDVDRLHRSKTPILDQILARNLQLAICHLACSIRPSSHAASTGSDRSQLATCNLTCSIRPSMLLRPDLIARNLQLATWLAPSVRRPMLLRPDLIARDLQLAS
jgi:hypothetical protein